MSKKQLEPTYRSYWVVWGILLFLTGAMLFAEVTSFPRLLVAYLLLFAMASKALLIGAQFMHLRFEKPGLVWAVAGTVFFLGLFLFILISFDGLRILKMVTQ